MTNMNFDINNINSCMELAIEYYSDYNASYRDLADKYYTNPSYASLAVKKACKKVWSLIEYYKNDELVAERIKFEYKRYSNANRYRRGISNLVSAGRFYHKNDNLPVHKSYWETDALFTIEKNPGKLQESEIKAMTVEYVKSERLNTVIAEDYMITLPYLYRYAKNELVRGYLASLTEDNEIDINVIMRNYNVNKIIATRFATIGKLLHNRVGLKNARRVALKECIA